MPNYNQSRKGFRQPVRRNVRGRSASNPANINPYAQIQYATIVGNNPREMANSVLSIPGARQELAREGLRVEDLIHSVDVAVGEQMGWHNMRGPGCDVGNFGNCNGSGGCIGLGCLGTCNRQGNVSMNWEFGGSMSGGGSWSGGLEYNYSGGNVSVNCNFGFTF